MENTKRVDLGDRWVDPVGIVVFKADGLIKNLYEGTLQVDDLKRVIVEQSKEIDVYNHYCDVFDQKSDKITVYQEPSITDIREIDQLLRDQWVTPEAYQQLDLRSFLYEKIATKEEKQRVDTELDLFQQHNLIDVAKLLIYLVEIMRKNQIVWGVGRGSSVASYILYLIGVHKINSFKYNLDIKEFIR